MSMEGTPYIVLSSSSLEAACHFRLRGPLNSVNPLNRRILLCSAKSAPISGRVGSRLCISSAAALLV